MLRWLARGLMVSGLLGALAAQQQEPQPTAAQQRPVFRGGTHFVRVDAYPTHDGKIVENLKPEDFEVLEDGKPQQIDSFDFVRFDTFTPEAERRDPSSQREGFDLAADPRYRVFVIVTDLAFSTSAGAVVRNNDVIHIQQPLVNFLDRILGSQDLYGFVTSRNSVKDLVLARKSTVTQSQIMDMWRSSIIDKDDADQLFGCSAGSSTLGAIQLRHRADMTYTLLHDLVRQLGSLRQERKNVVLATNLLPRWGPDQSLLKDRKPVLPRVGIVQGRLGTRDPMTVGAADESYCAGEFLRLALMDFDPRFRELLREARKENVSFYVVTPGGLQAPVTIGDRDALKHATDDLISLAHETDGIAIVNTNDLNGGMKRIADDLAAYYVLGYYTTNTKFDGNVRQIKVRLKPSGTNIRARRQYRAPTEAEIAALSASASRPGGGRGSGADASALRETALAALDDRAHSRKPDTPARTLIGEPAVFRVAPRSAAQPVSILHFDRADRIRIDWPMLAPTDGRGLRLLDRAGRPLPVDLPLTEDPATRGVSLAFPLAAFSRADYIVELTVTAGAVTERTLLALRVK